MKKKILSIAFIVSLTAIVGGNILKNSNKQEQVDLSLVSNIEALAEGETVQIPCAESENDTCEFSVINAQGRPGTMTISKHVKV